VLGKQHRNPFKSSASETARPLALVHTDLCGPLPVTSMGGSNYFVTLLDDYSKFSVVQPLTHKSDTAAAVKSTLIMLENQTGVHVQRLRCDNGSEYINADLTAFCREKGIKLETTVRYTPEQNGAAERLNRPYVDGQTASNVGSFRPTQVPVGRGSCRCQLRAEQVTSDWA
jgi:transposase InsO family protein